LKDTKNTSYIETENLKENSYYYCITYNRENIVVQYFGDGLFATDLDFRHIRYVIAEVPDPGTIYSYQEESNPPGTIFN